MCNKLISLGTPVSELLVEADAIVNPAERNSAKSGVRTLQLWVEKNADQTFEVGKITRASPSGLYKVTYQPDFGVVIGGSRLAVHIWNTMKPELEQRMVEAALAPFVEEFHKEGLDGIAVLSLRDGRLFRLDSASAHIEYAAIVYGHIEHVLEEIGDDGRRSPAEDRPTAS